MRLIFLALLLFPTTSVLGLGNLHGLAIKSALIGKLAPDAVLLKTDGTSGSVIGSRQGQKAILVFWATWCPNCYEELGMIDNMAGSVQQKGIKIILVDVGETQSKVKEYLLRRQLKLVSFIDTDSYLQDPYRITEIPIVIFIDGKGIVRSVTHQFPSNYENYFNP